MNDSERELIHQLVPTAPLEIPAMLRELSADSLVETVLATEEPWWRRRACALALSGRVPDQSAAALLRCLDDPKEAQELRGPLLETLAIPGRLHSQWLLTWLRVQEKVEQAYGMDIAVLKARAALGDITAIPALSELAADEWTHRRKAGEAAIDSLIEQRGERSVLDAFGAKAMEALAFQQQRSVAARLLGVRLVHRAGGDITGALGDSSVIVAQHAATLLSSEKGGEGALWERANKRAPGHVWAMVVLQRRGADVKEAWLSLEYPRVLLPGIPADIREAIVRNYVPGERQTDPRFLLEAAYLEPRPEPEEDEFANRAERALSAAGMEPERPISVGQFYGQGGGTFFVINTARCKVEVSTLGPFFRGDEAAVKVLCAAGFRHIDDDLGILSFERLCVYYFGRRDWLSVHPLLFYWQD